MPSAVVAEDVHCADAFWLWQLDYELQAILFLSTIHLRAETPGDQIVRFIAIY